MEKTYEINKTEEKFMMMAQVVCRESMVTKNIFGACIYNTKIVPERQKMEERKEKIKQLFGLVDDYIEQA